MNRFTIYPLALLLMLFNSVKAQPYSISITSSVADGALPSGVTVSGGNPKVITFSGSSNVSLNPATILTSLNNGNDVQIVTTGSRKSIVFDADITKTSGSDATLTLAATERITLSSGRTIESTSGKLHIVLRSDIDAADNNAGASCLATLKTNGGHFWMGGTSTNNGTATWSGLTVGNGPSRGSTDANWGSADLVGLIDTRVQSNLSTGGNVLIWAGTGVWPGIAIKKTSGGSEPQILAGNGNVTLIAKNLRNWDGSNATLEIGTTGTLTLASPAETEVQWGSFDLQNTGSGADFTLPFTNGYTPTSDTRPLKIKNFTSLGSLVIGSYTGMTQSSINILTYVHSTNTTISSDISFNGAFQVHGGNITLNGNVSTASSAISLYANAISFAIGKTVSSSGELLIAPLSPTTTIGIAGGTGTLQITSSNLSSNFSNGFSNITIGTTNQSGTITANAFTLQDHMTLNASNGVTLGGAITLGDNNIAIGDNTSVTATSLNYFKTTGTGVVKRTIGTNTSFSFPIGNAYYNPVEITNKTGAADLFNTRVVDAVYVNGNSGATLTDPRVDATWHIGKTTANAGAGVDFSFSWNTAQEQNSINTFSVQHSNGINWATAAGSSATPTLSGTTRTLSHTGYTGSFSPFAIGQAAIVLPVTWLSFTAEKQGIQSKLRWVTASEQNTQAYEVQYSTNSQRWITIGKVAASNNGTIKKEYSFIHNPPSLGQAYNYYRIMLQDLDGKNSYSSIVSLKNDEPVASLNIYPNPAVGMVTISLSKTQHVKFINASGVNVWSGNLPAGNNQISLTKLTRGVYWIVSESDKKQLLIQ